MSVVQDQVHTDSSEYVGDQWSRLLFASVDIPVAERMNLGSSFIRLHPDLPQGFHVRQKLTASGQYTSDDLNGYLEIWRRYNSVDSPRPVLSMFLAQQICEPIANMYMFNMQYDSALFWLERIERFNPRNPALYNSKGQALMLMNRFRESEKQYLKAISLDDNYIRAYYSLAYLYYFNNAKTDEAIDLTRHYISAETDPKKRSQAEKLLNALLARKNSMR